MLRLSWGLSVWCVTLQCSLFNNKAMPSVFHTSGRELKEKEKESRGSRDALLHFLILFWAHKLPRKLATLGTFQFLARFKSQSSPFSTKWVSVALKAPICCCCKWLRNNERRLMTNNKLILNLALNLTRQSREREKLNYKAYSFIKDIRLL